MTAPDPAPSTLRRGQFASVCALGLCGLVGGCLILSQQGFTTSGKRGGWSIFVPAPQAYVMAAIMFALSALALLWVLRERRARRGARVIAWLVHACAVVVLMRWLAGHLR